MEREGFVTNYVSMNIIGALQKSYMDAYHNPKKDSLNSV